MKAPSVTAWRCAKSITGRTQGGAAASRKTSSAVPSSPHAAHHLDSERDGAPLGLEPLAKRGELLGDALERVLARASEQEPGVDDDDLGPEATAMPAEWSSIPEGPLVLPVPL